MRHSPLRHPLAVLRITIGLNQKEMGDLVKRARVTIQAVELGKMPLSEGLACRIAEATGVELKWLLDGDPTAPLRKAGGGSYTRADYERHRASREIPASTFAAGTGYDRELVAEVERLLQTTVAATAGEWVRWKLRRMLAGLSCESIGTTTSAKGDDHD